MSECNYRKPLNKKFDMLSNELRGIIEGDCFENIKVGMCLSILNDVYFLWVDDGYDSCYRSNQHLTSWKYDDKL